jgi:AcrR family transcriptional regulator
MAETKERILDTAERLFAEHGYAATSLRAIISEADVNLAAVHYHFHTKEALLEAIILRRGEPANRERLEMLERFEEEAGGRPLALEKVIEAFVEPAFRVARDPVRGGPVFRHMIGRLYAESDVMPKILATHFRPLLERFGRALQQALPELPPDELFWRIHFAFGAIAQALRGGRDWEITDSPLRDSSAELTLDRLIAFVSAGFRAPVVRRTTEAHAIQER